MECKFCKKICKNSNSLRNHERLCSCNPTGQKMVSNFIEYNTKIKLGLIKKDFSNQYSKATKLGLPKPEITKESRLKRSLINSNVIWSEDRKKLHSIAMKKAVESHPDSYIKNNVVGRVKNILYNGIKLKGSWELIVAKWLDSKQIMWEHETKSFYYEWNGKRKYYPDFYLPELDKYIEVKGYETQRDRCKWKVVPNLIVIKKHEIEQIKLGKYNGLV